MQTLFNLIHSLAKEEKRLYKLHGRDGRFVSIYEGYLHASEYNKNLDRQLYQKHFSSFSKAFYSMQKTALLEDILAVLLEYSNSSKDEYNLVKIQAKAEILILKGFYDQALQYLANVLNIAEKMGDPAYILRALENYRDTLARSESVKWKDFEKVLDRITKVREESSRKEEIKIEKQKLRVLFRSAQNNPDDMDLYRSLSLEVLKKLKVYSEETSAKSLEKDLFEGEYLFSKTFEDKFDLHKRLVALEKKFCQEDYPIEMRLEVTNLLMESSLECGDFLLINGLVYKYRKEIPNLTEAQKEPFLPRFLELAGIYHFYENDLPLSQRELGELLQLQGLEKDRLVRNYYHLVAVLIAANLPRSARGKLSEFVERYPEMNNEIPVKLLDLVISVESNDREEALIKMQRLQSFIRKHPNSRKLTHIRTFLEMIEKLLNRKTVRWQQIPALETQWIELFKPNLWIKAKVENNFYYNYILDYWQERKQIINA